MNFLKSVFSPDPSPSNPLETLIQTFRRDLEEFGSGLKSETSAIRSAATRAIRDLPSSLESGASAAQESLESVGQAIDDFSGSVWRGTAEIISESKDALFPVESRPSDVKRYSRLESQVLALQEDLGTFTEAPGDAEEFARWMAGFRVEEKEEEIEMICYESGRVEGFLERLVPGVVDYESFWARYFYKVWKVRRAEEARARFVKRAILREEEEEDLSWEVDDEEVVGEGGEVARMVEEVGDDGVGLGCGKRIDGVARDLRLKASCVDSKEEEEEGKMVDEEKSVIECVEEREEKVDAGGYEKRFDGVVQDLSLKALSVDREEEEDEAKTVKKEKSRVECVEEEREEKVDTNDVELVHEKKFDGLPKDLSLKAIAAIDIEIASNGSTTKSGDDAESRRDSDISFVSSQVSFPVEEDQEDLGWDEIEDLGEYDDKKVGGTSSTMNKVDLHKKLSVLEEDEDLTWEIEDDD